MNIGSIGKKIVKKCGITFGDLHTAKDILLNDVVNIFLTQTEAGEIQWHFKIITCMKAGSLSAQFGQYGWTPQQLWIGRSSRSRMGWEPYEHSIQEVIFGRRDLTSLNMAARFIELNAFEKSTSRVNLLFEGMFVS